MTKTEKQNILIVDDKPENLLALESILNEPGVNLTKANSGKEALWLLLTQEFALIIMDVQMPEMDGFETAELIRKKENTKHIPIIFLTAISKEEKHIFRGYESGAVDYLFKPVDAVILKSKVSIFLDLDKQKSIIKHQAEDLRESEMRQAAILKSTFDCIISIDHEGKIIEFNPAAEKTFDYRRSDVIGQPMAECIIPPDLRSNYHQGLKNYFANGNKSILNHPVETNAIRADGSIFPVEISIAEIQLGDSPIFTAVLRDITKRKQAEEVTRRRNSLQSTINNILNISMKVFDLVEVLDQILGQIVAIPWLALKSKGAIFLVDDNSNELLMKSSKGLSDIQKATCARIPFGTCICGMAAQFKELQFVNCVDEKHDILFDNMEPHGHYCIPLKNQDNILGVLNLYIQEDHHRNKDEEDFLQAITNVITGVVLRKQFENKLQDEAIHDSLTRLYNRSYFFNRLTEAINIARRYKHPLSICICDLDNFKRINDTYGHKSGDDVLTTFAKILQKELRNTDISGRYGGDEFCIIFYNTPAAQAVESIERIRRRFQKEIFGKENPNATFSATATFGIADFIQSHETEKDIMSSADKALYQAKNLGRNCIVVNKTGFPSG